MGRYPAARADGIVMREDGSAGKPEQGLSKAWPAVASAGRMSMLRVMAAVTALGIGVTIAHAQNLDVIKQRRDIMKTIATGSLLNFKMTKGEAPFDLAKVKSSLQSWEESAAKFKTLFPEDSKTGGDTDAAPKIWEARSEFNAAADNLIAVAKAAAAAITDEASLKAEYPKVARACGGCHNNTDGFAPGLAASFKKLNQ
jgi:cytochrome c556